MPICSPGLPVFILERLLVSASCTNIKAPATQPDFFWSFISVFLHAES
jgi:hypothetical protein